MRIKINFNENEQKIIILAAKIRTATAKREGFHNNWNEGKRTAEDIDLQGFGAEMAFAKFYNLYPDFSGEMHKGSVDFITEKGKRIDVKHSIIDNGRLLVKQNQAEKKADVYVLVVGLFPNFEIVGFADKETVFSSEVKNNYGYGNNYTVINLTAFTGKALEKFRERFGNF